MNIKSIRIRNVRGLGDHTIQLDMIPNKPSILIAPNGAGKSSFALAFQWLGKLKMKLVNEEDAYNDDPNNFPEMEIVTDEPANNVYVANSDRNDISKKFGIYVINNGLRATSPGVHAGVQIGKSKITVPDIELLRPQPANVNLIDDFDKHYSLEDLPNGLFPAVTNLLSSNSFMSVLIPEALKLGKREKKKIDDFIEKVKVYTGTIAARQQKIVTDDLAVLLAIKPISFVADVIKKIIPEDSEVKSVLKALRIVTLYDRKPNDFKGRVDYAQYKDDEASVRALFDTMKKTWRDIKPRIKDGKLWLSIGDAQRISNGERDILTLIARLQNAQSAFTKEHNILIIDEVFDYMDDANLIAAQHYVNKLISNLKDRGRNIYPIILSHINPSYFRTFAFKDMKVYYLMPLQYPNASNNMMKLVRKRDELERVDRDKANLISKYMLHFHVDYTRNLTDVIEMDDPNWGDIPTFKAYCKRQLDNYMADEATSYDALAVCVELREIIEKYCYDNLPGEEQKAIFLDKKMGTEPKLEYADEQGVVCPETFSLLGLIYNDPLHPNNKNKVDLRQTLYSRLENNTIKEMIKEILRFTQKVK